MCPLGQAFFGLTPKDQELFLEQIFLLMRYGDFTFTEAYKLPVTWRRWFIRRINKELKKQNSNNKDDTDVPLIHTISSAMSSAPQNTQSQQMPAKLKRFS